MIFSNINRKNIYFIIIKKNKIYKLKQILNHKTTLNVKLNKKRNIKAK
jgi:hypothetical protein